MENNGDARQQLASMPDVLTVEETAAVLRISRGMAYEAVRQHRIPAVRIGKRLLVPKTALVKLLTVGD